MINKERIVPVSRVDLLTLVGMILNLIGTSYTVLKSKNIVGDFSVQASGAAGNLLADQPVKSLDFASGTTSGTVYFVADYKYTGITVAGAAATYGAGSATVEADAATLYKAELSSGTVTVTAISPAV